MTSRPEAVARPVAQDPNVARFHREGAVWSLEFEGLSVQLTHQKGFSDLARLLDRPGVEVHCLELADRPAETTGTAPQLDERARREIQARARELQHDIDQAEAAHDLAQAERAREELDQIVELLSGALGLGGRSRALGSAAERAGPRSRGGSAVASRRSPRPIPSSGGTWKTRCARARSASTSQSDRSSGASSRRPRRESPATRLRGGRPANHLVAPPYGLAPIGLPS